MAESFWDSEQLIAEVRKNSRGEVIAIKLVTKNNRRYVDVRNFYVDKDGGLAPAKGIALPIDLAEQVAMHIKDAVAIGQSD
ncbi:MAG TPA: transcriptional coactivator p15 [Firmicutes bacterium]|jgi:hypothetical protein|nr:transcriptional coactivator p15 [Bacillota bacterium]